MSEAEPGRARRLAALRAVWRKLAGPPRAVLRASGGRRLVAAVGVAVLATAAAMLLLDPIGLDAVGTWSRSTMRVFRTITSFGDSAWYLVPSGLALIALGFVPPASRRVEAALGEIWLRFAFFFLAVAGTGIAVNVGKRLIGRVRPLHVEPGMVWHFEPLGWKSAAASFPSGHATTAFAVVTALALLGGPRFVRLGLPWLVAGALLVCLSRVVLGAHFPSDVMAGALFGTLGTWWFAHFLARRRLVFRQTAPGALALRGAHASKTLRAVLAGDKVS
ncbi:phosphatase PAP2 family protein [Labrys wisconsinensis]|uniref:Undecaprenyl-diphosphatase n=1 Tax=Labrys wisconsinensis TaxID=425677 RepID=A0ABU0J4H2_9HYPH|nr:phosphatase PAP2 family protein [Labrys wisconsinensis]MDQ0468328.1 undecaprenyl-diphosphatase [Labrys wisconsinensis]